ncbi:type II secretion system protein [Vibrio sp. SM6]|uniref:Type II secretion system protein n=1 Tax=Vibrio agarilyticus TaxID=2726741 RepID=A0A7X8YHY6_9VIBR|nr:type II secretion system protein [Vibrio agarilyticus]NLS14603.1 type II secretion system protein [Vibrio agarilyticus]
MMTAVTPTLNRHRGFTLIELVVVIILLAIVAAFAASRYAGVESVSPFAAQQRAIAIIKQIQLARMQSTASENSNAQFQLQLGPNCFGAKAACVSDNSSMAMALEGLTIKPLGLVIEFDLFGSPKLATGESSGNITIEFQSSAGVSASLCLNSIGFVAVGACS